MNAGARTRAPARGTVRDVAAGATQIARGLVPLRRATPRRLVRVASTVSTYGLTLAGLTQAASIRDGRDVVLVDRAGPVTADQLDRWSATVAGELARREIVVPGGKLGVLCRSGRGFLIAAVAASRIGADVVLLHPSYRATELAEVIRAEDVRVVAHDEALADLLASARFRGATILADAAAPGSLAVPSLAALPRADVPPPRRPGRLVLLSSGRGGRPRSAHRSAPGMAAALPVTTLVRRLRIRRRAPLMILPPLHHPLGLGFMLVSLGLGGRAVVRDRFDPEATLALLDEHEVETLVTLPRMLLRLTEALGERPPPRSLRTIVSGGGPLLPAVWKRATSAFGPIVHNLYGSVGVGWCTVATPADLWAAPGTIGRPVSGVELSILDDDGEPVATNELGRVFVSSAAVALDDRRPPASRRDPVDTRDVGHHDEAGRLFVDARAGHVRSLGGRPLYPGALEQVLLEHPAVADVAVTPGPGPDAAPAFVVRVARRAGVALEADAFRSHLAQRFPGVVDALDVRVVSAVPLTDAGQPAPIDDLA